MSDYQYGVYILQVYAGTSDLSKSGVLESFKLRYGGNASVEALGKISRGLSVMAVQKEFKKISQKEGIDVSRASLNEAILKIGGKSPSSVKLVAEGIASAGSEIASGIGEAVSFGKWLIPLALIGGIIYLGIQTGYFKRAG